MDPLTGVTADILLQLLFLQFKLLLTIKFSYSYDNQYAPSSPFSRVLPLRALKTSEYSEVEKQSSL